MGGVGGGVQGLSSTPQWLFTRAKDQPKYKSCCARDSVVTLGTERLSYLHNDTFGPR